MDAILPLQPSAGIPKNSAILRHWVGLQPASIGIMMERLCNNLGIDKKTGIALSEKTMYDITGLNFDQLSPVEHAKSVTIRAGT